MRRAVYFRQVYFRAVYLAHAVYVHEQAGRAAVQYVRDRFLRFYRAYIMPLGYYAVAVYPAGAFNGPCFGVLGFKTAGVADKFLHFAVFILAGGYAEHFVAAHPQYRFAAAFIAVAVRIYRFQEPYAVLETEGFIRERAYRAYINHVADKVIVQGFVDVGAYFRCFATAQHAVLAAVGELVGGKYTTVTEYAARHVQLYPVAYIYLVKGPALELVAGAVCAMLVAQVL